MIFPDRRYRTSQPWALWHWTDITIDGELYLRRLHLIKIPKVGAIMLHWIYQPDFQKDLHDHPVMFLSIVLRGWYHELRKDRIGYVTRWNFVRATDAHRIDQVSPGGVLTLVFATSNLRRWGFHTPAGWVFWQDYEQKDVER